MLVLEDLLAAELRHCDWIPCDTPATATSSIGHSTASNADVVVLDVGTGASAIYALLAHAACGWRTVATDTNEIAVRHAAKLIADNDLTHRVNIVHACQRSTETVLHDGQRVGIPVVRAASESVQPPAVEYTSLETDTLLRDVLLHLSQNVGISAAGGPQSLWLPNSATGARSLDEKVPVDKLHSPEPQWLAWARAKAPNLSSAATTRLLAATMCNPPFFSTWFEAEASMAGNVRSTCSGSPAEMVRAHACGYAANT